MEFAGWFTAPVGGEKVEEDTLVTIVDFHYLYAQWINTSGEDITFTVTFYKNWGIPDNPPITRLVTLGQPYGEMPEFIRPGYVFAGWGSQTQSYKNVTSETIVTIAADHYLYAIWVPDPSISYTVTFNPGEGNLPGNQPSQKDVKVGSPYGALPIAIRARHTLVGWFIDAPGDPLHGTRVTKETIVQFMGDHTLKAFWSNDNGPSYIVSFDSNGGSDPNPVSKSLKLGALYGVLPKVSREGYWFGGWYLEANGSRRYIDAETIMEHEADHTLVADWSPMQVKVGFMSNGTLLEVKTVVFDEAYGAMPEPYLRGHTFAGWFTEPEGGWHVTSASLVKTASNHMLYARWKTNVPIPPVPVIVSYYNVGDEVLYVSFRMVIMGQAYGEFPAVEREGYVFDGWYTSINGDERVTESTVVRIAGDHDLYARWSDPPPQFHKVTIRNAGETALGPFQVSHGDTVDAAQLGSPEKEWYDFKGWYGDPMLRNLYDFTLPVLSDITIYGKWERQSVNVTFDVGYRPGSSMPQTLIMTLERGLPFAQGAFAPVFNQGPERAGYTFLGWYKNDVRINGNELVTETAPFTLTAKWELAGGTTQTVLVSYDANGGQPDPAAQTLVVGQPYGTMPAVSRAGYELDRWILMSTGGTKTITADTLVTETSAHTLVAQWTEVQGPTQMQVYFEATGGTPQPHPITVTQGEPYGPLPVVTKTGYEFRGWYLNLTEGIEVKVEKSTIVAQAEDHPLYAMWSPVEVKVHLIVQGGAWESADLQYGELYGSNDNLQPYFNGIDDELIPDGFEFVGWFTAPVGGTQVFSDTPMLRTDAHALYGQLRVKPRQVTVSFNAQGGEPTPAPKTVTVGAAYGVLPIVSLEGYEFDGWYKNANLKIGLVRNTTRVTEDEDHTLYAHWSKTPDPVVVQVHFDSVGGLPAPEVMEVTVGQTYGALPVVTRTAHVFKGWWTKAVGGTEVKSATEVTNNWNHRLYARWEADGDNWLPYSVYFIPDRQASLSHDRIFAYPGNQYGLLSAVEATGNYGPGWPMDAPKPLTYDINYKPKLLGWYTDDGQLVTEQTYVALGGPHNLTARWTTSWTHIQFHGNGGVMTDGQGKTHIDSHAFYFGGEILGKVADNDFMQFTREGYTFLGWYTDVSGGYEFKDKTVIQHAAHNGITLYARWQANDPATVDPNRVNVIFTGTSVAVAQPTAFTYGGAYGLLPEPARTGYTFTGWEDDLGNQITENTLVFHEEDHLLYATWVANVYQVSFNTTGGIPLDTVLEVTYGTAYGPLPVPQHQPNMMVTFDGWYTAEGERVTADTIMFITSNHVLHAKWRDKYNPPLIP